MHLLGFARVWSIVCMFVQIWISCGPAPMALSHGHADAHAHAHTQASQTTPSPMPMPEPMSMAYACPWPGKSAPSTIIQHLYHTQLLYTPVTRLRARLRRSTWGRLWCGTSLLGHKRVPSESVQEANMLFNTTNST